MRVRLDNKTMIHKDTPGRTTRKKKKKFGLTFDLENEQMQYQQGPPQQVVVKEKKKNQGCLAVW